MASEEARVRESLEQIRQIYSVKNLLQKQIWFPKMVQVTTKISRTSKAKNGETEGEGGGGDDQKKGEKGWEHTFRELSEAEAKPYEVLSSSLQFLRETVKDAKLLGGESEQSTHFFDSAERFETRLTKSQKLLTKSVEDIQDRVLTSFFVDLRKVRSAADKAIFHHTGRHLLRDFAHTKMGEVLGKLSSKRKKKGIDMYRLSVGEQEAVNAVGPEHTKRFLASLDEEPLTPQQIKMREEEQKKAEEVK